MTILLCAANDTMLHCSAKSKLMDILEKMSSAEASDDVPPEIHKRDVRKELLISIWRPKFQVSPKALISCHQRTLHG